MKRMYLMKGMAALAFGLVAVSCNKSDIFNPYQQQEENQKKSEAAFAENVMDGKTIDANQTWSTANAMEVSVTPSATGTLKIYTANPIGNVVAPLYTANVTAGAQTTFTVTKPADVQALYATVYKAEGQIVNLQAFDATGSKAEVNFNSTTGNRAARRAAPAKPTEPAYDKTNPIVAPTEPTDMPSSTSAKNKITANSSNSFDFNGDQTYYIAENVVLSNVNSIGDRCKVYMASGSKIVFTNQAWLKTGTIIYNDGGTIEFSQGLFFDNAGILWNKGTVDLKNKDISYSNDNGTIFNSGIIKNVNNFTVGQGGMLWNVGSINATGTLKGYNNGSKIYNGNIANKSITVGSLELGNSNQYFWNDGLVNVTGTIKFTNSGAKFANNGTLKGNKFDISAGSQFVNYTDAEVVITESTDITNSNAIWINNGTYQSGTYMVKAGGNQVFNNCRLTVTGKFTMGNGDGSRFVLNGDAAVIADSFDWVGDNYFWMGSNSLLLVKGTLKSNNINNDGKGFHQYGDDLAVISANAITTDNVNGQGRICLYGKICVDANKIFDLNEKNHVAEGEVTFTTKQFTAQVPDSWKTPTTCRPAYIPKNPDPDPVMYYYYAFEDLGTTNDFDFNDVVIRVSAPNNGTSTVQLMCAGGTMSTKVTYGTGSNVRTLCDEVHAAFGISNIKTMINTGAGAEATFPVSLGTIENLTADTDMSRLPFGITCQGNEGQVIRVENSVANHGKAPLVIVVNGYPSGDNAGKWFWSREYINIVNPYEQFGAWGANVKTNANWYLNYTERKDGKVILYKW